MDARGGGDRERTSDRASDPTGRRLEDGGVGMLCFHARRTHVRGRE
jgi:hypothetical protein